MDKSKEVKKAPVFLFSEEKPKGEMFSFYGGEQSEECQEMLKNGWTDTPARLKLPKEMNTGILADEAVNADPQLLIKVLEDIGFFVLTQEQLQAEANKMASAAIDMDNFSDEDLINEAIKRGLKESSEEEPEESSSENLMDSGSGSADDKPPTLQERFKENNESLEKDELIHLGKELKLNFMPNWKEETMIKKINEKLEA
jgi:hypothetical protein